MGKVLQWLGLQTRADGGGPSPAVLPPARSGGGVTLDRALTVPATYRAITILATSVSQLELGVWRNGREIATPALARKPDVNQTRAQFLKRTVIGLAGTGNAYWRRVRDWRGDVASLEALNPLAMHAQIDARTGAKTWHYSDPYRGPMVFPGSDVAHLRLLEVPGHLSGVGPIQSCRLSVSGALDLRDYSSTWFSNSAIPTGVLSSQGQLTPAQADEYKRRWKETQETRDVAVLGHGLAYEPIILKPADAQFLESQQFTVTDIARMFGIPAAYLLAEVNGSSMTYQNLEMADTQFAKYTLMTYLSEIEGALTELLPHGQTARFKLEGLLRPDARTRAEVQGAYLDRDVLTVDEVREAEGYGPHPDPPPTREPVPAPPPAALAGQTSTEAEGADA